MVAPVFGPYVAEPTLASAQVRAREKAGHMSASDQITQANVVPLRAGGRPHMAPGRSVPDDLGNEALALAGGRPGWGAIPRARRASDPCCPPADERAPHRCPAAAAASPRSPPGGSGWYGREQRDRDPAGECPSRSGLRSGAEPNGTRP